MKRALTLTAVSSALALSLALSGAAIAQEKKIAVTMMVADKSETKSMTAAELRDMLTKTGFKQDATDKAIAAGQKDGKLTIRMKAGSGAKK